MVDSSGGAVAYGQPAYYYDPWYWTPVGVGFGASFIFVDRFHHAHSMRRVFLPARAAASMAARAGRLSARAAASRAGSMVAAIIIDAGRRPV